MSFTGAVMIAATLLGVPPALPDEASGWKAVAPDDHYDPRTIFQYIDGHGEVYLAYGMAACHARRYVGPEGEGAAVVDMFEMASPADAFGVFTHSREGNSVAVGQGASFGFGTLSFWKGRHFVSVSAEQETERARAGRTGRSAHRRTTSRSRARATAWGRATRPGSTSCASASPRTRSSEAATASASASGGPLGYVAVGADPEPADPTSRASRPRRLWRGRSRGTR